MKKSKIFKGVCATVLAAATIGLVAPKVIGSINMIESNKSVVEPAAATNTTALSIEDVYVNPSSVLPSGTGFTMKVDISGVPSTGVNCFEFAVKYDPEVVKISSVTGGGTIGEFTEDECNISSGMIYLGYASTDVKITDGTLITITGSALTAPVETDFEVVPIDRASYPGSTNKINSIYVGYMNVSSGDITTLETDLSNASGTLYIVHPTQPTPTTTTAPGPNPTDKPTTTTKTTTTTAKPTTDPTQTTAPPNTDNTTSGVPLTKKGDIDLNGDINVADLVYLNNYLINKASLPNANQAKAADLNDDGRVNVFDSVALRRYLLNN